MGCGFCLTGTLGLSANLNAAQIVEQMVAARRLQAQEGGGVPITNVVFMGARRARERARARGCGGAAPAAVPALARPGPDLRLPACHPPSVARPPLTNPTPQAWGTWAKSCPHLPAHMQAEPPPVHPSPP